MKINFIKSDYTNIIPKMAIHVNLLNLYYIKLYKTWITSEILIVRIYFYHILNLSIDANNYVYYFNLSLISKNLYLLVLK